MLTIGLTGGIGCGKSLVSDLFHELYAIPIIDADIIAKELTHTRQVIDKISTKLGKEFIDANKQLLRKKLREAIFSDKNLRDTLENILHPLVYEKISTEIDKLDTNYCIVVIPLLFETKRVNIFDRVLVVDCTVEEQVSRVMQRDQCSRTHVEKIIASQVNRQSRLALADDVIENSGNIESVKDKVTVLHKKYTGLAQSKHSI